MSLDPAQSPAHLYAAALAEIEAANFAQTAFTQANEFGKRYPSYVKGSPDCWDCFRTRCHITSIHRGMWKLHSHAPDPDDL